MAIQTAPRRALSLRKIRGQLGLSRERMARLLDASTKTIERWEERDAVPPSSLVRGRLARMQEIARLGHTVYRPEGFERFLSAPLAELGGRSPLQLIELGQADQVLAALAADYEGLGA